MPASIAESKSGTATSTNAPKYQSPFQRMHQIYTDRGYHVLPIAHGSKAPGVVRDGKWTGLKWRGYADAAADMAAQKVWAAMRDRDGHGAGIGIALGTPAGDDDGGAACVTVALDFDPAEGCPNEAEVTAAVGGLLPGGWSKRGKKGATWIACMRVSDTGRGFDYAGADGSRLQVLLNAQTVMPPSIHPDTGKPYARVGEIALQPVGELPLLDIADLDAAMKGLGYGRGSGGAALATTHSNAPSLRLRPTLR